jgi:imidazolonepropionase-like amidohydrolase
MTPAHAEALAPPQFSIIHAGQLLAVPGKPPVSKATITVEKGIIKQVQGGYVDATILGLPAETPVIDLTNQFVMPGFIDRHVH